MHLSEYVLHATNHEEFGCLTKQGSLFLTSETVEDSCVSANQAKACDYRPASIYRSFACLISKLDQNALVSAKKQAKNQNEKTYLSLLGRVSFKMIKYLIHFTNHFICNYRFY